MQGHPGAGHPGGHPGGGHASGGHPGGGHPGEGHQRFATQYEAGAPWDIGRPQPELVALADDGAVPLGRVLDVGCGRGDNALFFAERGAEVVGIDGVAAAIGSAREKAASRGLAEQTTFIEGDVLAAMPEAGGPFDAVVDCGFFHALSDEQREQFVALLAEALRPGGVYAALMFSERVPGAFGPRRVSEAEIRDTFGLPLFEVVEVRPAGLHTAVPDRPLIDANLAVVRRM